MENSLSTNWDILRFKYEVLGISLEALAIDTGISIPLLERNSKNWKQVSLVEDDGSKVLSVAEQSSKLQSVMKSKILGPKYVELEMLLLYKAIEIANNMNDSTDNSNIVALKNLTDILSNLLSQNPSLIPAKQDTGEIAPTEQKWEINIVTGGVQENKTLNMRPN
jgi:hypothetical protein